ncbi:GNAT family N-acetyltransferase [Mucilaginibacter sp.]|uniref:GNAT family N-acetyltransferase n=1 Tax=Mucilaginibacter sp. TaxID=1882438 RepID=UPI0028480515|nr:GNAT family N-acetyltransferase [Mucilaginibacter sp.]MDR3697814.1 GNAT family N-acetyltransferase [Mucilaginibacter sp.]
MEQAIIRDANPGDLTALTLLMNELGYPTLFEEMKERFSKISANSDYKTIVAILNDEVVGMAGLAKGIFYEKNGHYPRVLAFVVKQNSRGKGIGKALLNTAESLAKELGITTVLINCGNREEREQAHKFYYKMGYAVKSSGFVKQL